VKIDQWYPSSKRCSDCGYIVENPPGTGGMPLDVREWVCSAVSGAMECGAVHDRDINAAKNILGAGLALAAGVGGKASRQGVRPVVSSDT
jgi:putative transposase